MKTTGLRRKQGKYSHKKKVAAPEIINQKWKVNTDFKVMCLAFGHAEAIWFSLVLWHINYCILFNAKSIFIHVKFYFIQFNLA